MRGFRETSSERPGGNMADEGANVAQHCGKTLRGVVLCEAVETFSILL